MDMTDFHYVHRGTDWAYATKLNYPKDVENIKSTFHLGSGRAEVLHRSNLKPTTETWKPENQFDWFVENEVLPGPKPSFLMFFLMTHGLKDGEFLLSDSSGNILPCCERDQHSFTKHCRARKVSDVIKKIDNAPKFDGIPKVFIIQACRGGRSQAIEEGNLKKTLEPHKPTEADKLLPECSDVFVFYAAIEDQLSWVDGRSGSLMIKEFCNSITESEDASTDCGTLWDHLCKVLQVPGGGRDLRALNKFIHQDFGLTDVTLVNDNIAQGWIENICSRTAAKVSDYLLKQHHTNGDIEFIKQQPQHASKLRFKFSLLKLVATLRHHSTKV